MSTIIKMRKELLLALVGIIFFILFVGGVFAEYTRALPSYTSSGGYSINTGTRVPDVACSEGIDFVVQVAPFGCSPAVVRSDLLEEQDYPVFCQLIATKLNPLIDVEAIQGITFKGQYPDGVKSVDFFPSRAALGYVGDLGLGSNEVLNRPVLNNIGYAIILLEKNGNESAMPDFVSGNLTAELRYNIKNAFGIGKVHFYLPESSNSEWESTKTQYSFWKGKGYLRAENVEADSATIGVYDESSRRVSSFTLKDGQTSEVNYLSGFQCLAGLRVKLDDVVNPSTRAKLEVNGDVVEAVDEEFFLDDQCQVKNVDRKGIVESVTIKCKGENSDAFTLRVVPKIKLKIQQENGDFEEGEYEIGDKLYSTSEKAVYLGYAGTNKDTGKSDDLFIFTFAMPHHFDKLDPDTLSSITSVVEGYKVNQNRRSTGLINFISEAAEYYSKGLVKNVYDFVVNGESYAEVSYGENKLIEGRNIQVLGFSEGANEDVNDTIKSNYDKAIQDYNTIINSYPSTSYEPPFEGVTKGEQAMLEKIKVSSNTGQKRDMIDFCDDFKETYSNSKLNGEMKEFCDNELKASSDAISSQTVSVQGKIKEITFERIKEPGFEEYGAEIQVKGPNGFVDTIPITHNQIIYLSRFRDIEQTGDKIDDSKREFIQLVELDNEKAVLNVQIIKSQNIVQEAVQFAFIPPTVNLKKGVAQGVEGGYTFNLVNVNLHKEAKVTVLPEIKYERSETPFSFRIDIEKRGIKLSPEKTQERITALEERIAEWQERNDKLGKVVSGMKTACLATGTILTAKNFLNNLDGKSIARYEVMRARGGWYEQCTNLVSQKTYRDVDECLSKNSDAIDDDVNAYYEKLQTQNEQLKTLQQPYEHSGFLGENNVDTDKFKEVLVSTGYKSELKANLHERFPEGYVEVNNEKIDIDTFVDNLKQDSASVSDFRDMQLLSRVEGSSTLDDISEAGLKDVMNSIYERNKDSVDRTTRSDKYGVEVDYISNKEIRNIPIIEDTIFSQVKERFNVNGPLDINDNDYVRIVYDKSTSSEYLLKLDNDRTVVRTYLIEGNQLISQENSNHLNLGFEKYDASSYNNFYKGSLGEGNPVIKYYETEPYVGLPAIVPFDLKKGWYAATKQTLPIRGAVASFADSGRVTSFFVCNVGKNGLEENIGGDDTCVQINTGTGQPYDQFPWLGSDESVKIVRCAEEAILQASQAYPASGKVSIDTACSDRITIDVGAPAVDIPDIKCQDVYSPSECRLLFNVCDPVICPSSRCDLGGAYPVKDVIQTGVIGSSVLCLPNFPEVYVPICISGVHAGIEGWISIMESHRDCLQHSLETGETVGICDEIYSIYACEMFWREGINVAKYAVPKLLEVARGQGSRGGGEYLGVQSAWDSAGKSVDFFTQYYATNSFEAFKARSIDNVGNSVCKVYVSGSFPIGDGAFDALIEPDSPSQFTGNFEEIPLTTATNPPLSQYKVFYHIFAGNDQGAYYRVYLKGGSGSSYYEDTNSILNVKDASGFIPAGDYATATVDFSAISGYKQLCIVVNNQEECGFKQVTTEFGLNYIKDQYIATQANDRDITSSRECVAGTSSAYSFALNPNIQAGANEFASPDVYNYDLIRICATQNPGLGSDPNADAQGERWIDVGYCDDRNLKCWLDTTSVNRSIKNANIREGVLQDQNAAAQQALIESRGLYANDAQFDDALENYTKAAPGAARINELDKILEKSFHAYHRGHVLYLRGMQYGFLAQNQYRFEHIAPDAEIIACETDADCSQGERCFNGQCLAYSDEPAVLNIEKDKEFLRGEGIDYSKMSDDQIRDAARNLRIKKGLIDVVQSPIFEYEDGLAGVGNLYYNYSYGEWYWSPTGNEWYNVREIAIDQEEVVISKDEIYVTFKDIELTGRNIQFIKTLNEESYYDGLGFLLGRTLANDEGGYRYYGLRFYTDPDLVANGVNFDHNGVFFKEISNKDVYFKFASDGVSSQPKWWFSLDNSEDWRTTVPSGTSSQISSVFNAIQGKNFVEGASIIFNIGLIPISEQPTYKSRESEEVALIITNFVGDGTINVDCLKYVDYIVNAANNYGVDDPLLLLALMQKESNCNVNAISPDKSSYGLIQINTVFQRDPDNQNDPNKGQRIGHCGDYGLPSNQEDCRESLLNPETNINVGAQILKKYYNENPLRYNCGSFISSNQVEQPIDKYYSGWERAFRNYNGWSCAGFRSDGSEIYADQDYVEKVLDLYRRLGAYNPDFSESDLGTDLGIGTLANTDNLITGKYILLKNNELNIVYCTYQTKGMEVKESVIDYDLDLLDCRQKREKTLISIPGCKFANNGFVGSIFFGGTDINYCHTLRQNQDQPVGMCYVNSDGTDKCNVCDYSQDCSLYKDSSECGLDPCVMGCKWDSNSDECVRA